MCRRPATIRGKLSVMEARNRDNVKHIDYLVDLVFPIPSAQDGAVPLPSEAGNGVLLQVSGGGQSSAQDDGVFSAPGGN